MPGKLQKCPFSERRRCPHAVLLADSRLKSGVCLVSPLLIQLWQAALSTLNPNPTDSCPLYLNYATVAALPSRVSRHNSPSAAHFITRLVRTCLPPGTHRCILVSAPERLAPHNPHPGRRSQCAGSAGRDLCLPQLSPGDP